MNTEAEPEAVANPFDALFTKGQFIAVIAVAVVSLLLCSSSMNPMGPDMSENEQFWRTVCTALITPMSLEYMLDEVAWAFYPTLRSHSKEDPVGHGFVVMSLIPSSFLSVWLLGTLNLPLRFVLMSIGHIVAIYGVLRKLETFSLDELGWTEPVAIFALFIASEAFLSFGVLSRSDSRNQFSTVTALVLKTIIVVILFTSSKVLKAVTFSKTPGSTFFTDRRYITMVLLSGLSMFILWDIMQTYSMLFSADLQVGQRVLSHIAFVIVVAVLPGRITRRGLAAVEESNLIMKEMAYKKTFVRYISHEVRSPLSTTSLTLDCIMDLLARPDDINREELMELASDGKTTCTTAIQTLSDLLLYDKVDSNMLQLERAEVECVPFIQQCVRPLEKQLKFSGLDWSLTIDNTAVGSFMNADKHKIEQVIRNFITNAIKFTPAGGAVRMRILAFEVDKRRYSTPSNQVKATSPIMSPAGAQGALIFRCEVTDSGPGISPENQAKLFGQYVQFDASKLQKGGGSGLGLWLSKAIVEAHGGVVGVGSKGLGYGCTFFFEVPAVHVETVKEVQILAEGGLPSLKSPLKQGTADDHDGTCDVDSELSRSRQSSISSSTTAEITAADFGSMKVSSDGMDHVPTVTPSDNAVATLVSAAPSFPIPEPLQIPPPPPTPVAPHAPLSSADDLCVLENLPAMAGVARGTYALNVLLADDATLTRKIVERLITSTRFQLLRKEMVTGSSCASPASRQSKPMTPALTESHHKSLPMSSKGSPSSSNSNDSVPLEANSKVSAEMGVEALEVPDVPLPPMPLPKVHPPALPHSSHGSGTSSLLREVLSVDTSRTIDGKSPRRILSRHGSSSDQNQPHGILSMPASQDSSTPVEGSFPTTPHGGQHPNVPGTPVSSAASASTGSSNKTVTLVCDHAANGQIAVDKVKTSMLPWRKAYDVVLIDYYMPILDGPAAIAAMRAAGYSGLIIAVTGSASKEDEANLVTAGADSIMFKPFDVRVFHDQLVAHKHELKVIPWEPLSHHASI